MDHKEKKLTVFKIRKFGDPVLREKASQVKEINFEIKNLVENLDKIRRDVQGIGIAATQVGILKRIFLYDLGEGTVVCINPRIVSQEGKLVAEEGCLSLPGVTIPIKRAEKVKLRAFDLAGNKIEATFEGLAARVIQHEIDHLNGILIIDRATKKERLRALQRLNEIAKVEF